MSRNRLHFVVLEENSYSIVADTFPSPDGNGRLNASDFRVVPVTSFKYALRINSDSSQTFTFDNQGLSNQEGTICVPSSLSPDIDCIVISRTRIHKGKIKKQDRPCDSDNCKPK